MDDPDLALRLGEGLRESTGGEITTVTASAADATIYRSASSFEEIIQNKALLQVRLFVWGGGAGAARLGCCCMLHAPRWLGPPRWGAAARSAVCMLWDAQGSSVRCEGQPSLALCGRVILPLSHPAHSAASRSPTLPSHSRSHSHSHSVCPPGHLHRDEV